MLNFKFGKRKQTHSPNGQLLKSTKVCKTEDPQCGDMAWLCLGCGWLAGHVFIPGNISEVDGLAIVV